MIPRLAPVLPAWVQSFASNLEWVFLIRPLTVSSVVELTSNLFVGISGRNRTQDADFRRGQGGIGGVLGELVGSLRWSFCRHGWPGSFPGVPYARVSTGLLSSLGGGISPKNSLPPRGTPRPGGNPFAKEFGLPWLRYHPT
jgi:hypothetical protein